MLTLRICLGLTVCIAGCFAQTDGDLAWEKVRSVRTGERVRVHSTQGTRNGTVQSVQGDAITLRPASGEAVTIPRADVTRVYTAGRSRRVRNLLIGTAVGAAVGAVLYGTLGELLRNETGDAPGLLLAPIGVGAAVGAAMPAGAWKKIYEKTP